MINGLSHWMPTLAWKVEGVSACPESPPSTAHSLRKAPSVSQLMAQSQQGLSRLKALTKQLLSRPGTSHKTQGGAAHGTHPAGNLQWSLWLTLASVCPPLLLPGEKHYVARRFHNTKWFKK